MCVLEYDTDMCQSFECEIDIEILELLRGREDDLRFVGLPSSSYSISGDRMRLAVLGRPETETTHSDPNCRVVHRSKFASPLRQPT